MMGVGLRCLLRYRPTPQLVLPDAAHELTQTGQRVHSSGLLV